MDLADRRALCFEALGTLIDRESGIHAALGPLARKSGLRLPRTELLARYNACEVAVLQASQAPSFTALLAGAHRRLAESLGLYATEADHQLFAESVRHWPTYVEVPAALQYLRRFFRMFLVTRADGVGLAAASKRRLPVGFDSFHAAGGVSLEEGADLAYALDWLLSQDVQPGEVVLISARPAARATSVLERGAAVVLLDRSGQVACAVEHPLFLRLGSLVDLVRLHQQQLTGPTGG